MPNRRSLTAPTTKPNRIPKTIATCRIQAGGDFSFCAAIPNLNPVAHPFRGEAFSSFLILPFLFFLFPFSLLGCSAGSHASPHSSNLWLRALRLFSYFYLLSSDSPKIPRNFSLSAPDLPKSSNEFVAASMMCRRMNGAPSLAPCSLLLMQHSHSRIAHPGKSYCVSFENIAPKSTWPSPGERNLPARFNHG